MTGGSGVRGKVDPIWVRKVFNCLHFLYKIDICRNMLTFVDSLYPYHNLLNIMCTCDAHVFVKQLNEM
jgi:hypothetical protein